MDMLILFSALFAYQSMVIILYIQQKWVSLSSNSNKDDIIFKCIQNIYQNSLLNHKKFFEKTLCYTKHSQGSLEQCNHVHLTKRALFVYHRILVQRYCVEMYSDSLQIHTEQRASSFYRILAPCLEDLCEQPPSQFPDPVLYLFGDSRSNKDRNKARIFLQL